MPNYTGGAILANMNRAYDYYIENPDSTVRDMAFDLEIALSSARSRVDMMVRLGYLRQTGKVNAGRGNSAAIFKAIKNRRPDSNDVKPDNSEQQYSLTHKVVKAVQLGMPPYADLPRDFFGEARAVA